MNEIIQKIIENADINNYKKILEISRKATSVIYQDNCTRIHARTARLNAKRIFSKTKVYLLKTYADEVRKIIVNSGIADDVGSDEEIYNNILKPLYLYVIKKNK